MKYTWNVLRAYLLAFYVHFSLFFINKFISMAFSNTNKRRIFAIRRCMFVDLESISVNSSVQNKWQSASINEWQIFWICCCHYFAPQFQTTNRNAWSARVCVRLRFPLKLKIPTIRFFHIFFSCFSISFDRNCVRYFVSENVNNSTCAHFRVFFSADLLRLLFARWMCVAVCTRRKSRQNEGKSIYLYKRKRKIK